MPDGPIRTDINQREAAFRADAERIANMAPSLQQIAASVGSDQGLNPGEIPTVGYLANMKATAKQASTNRTDRSNAAINNLPSYINSYRTYLKWRYPKRYGGGSGDYSYSTAAYNPWGGLLQMPGITDIPGGP